MRGEYGYITVKGEKLPLTLRGYLALIVGGSVLGVAGVYVLVLVWLFALLP